MSLSARLRRNAARARARGAPAVAYSEADVYARGRGTCYLCGRPVARDAFVIEHVIPIARGGPDVLTNVMPAHAECNARKGARLTHLPDGPLRRALVQTLVVCARLARVGVVTSPLPPTIAPHVVTVRLRTAPGHAHLTAAATAEARAAVNCATARVYVAGAELRVELPRWPRRTVRLADMPARGLRFGVGVDAANRVVAIDLAAAPGVLVAGQSGSGKSEALRVIVAHLARAGASLVLVDCDGQTFAPFSRCAALACAVATDVDAAADAVAHFRALMDARQVDVPHPPLALVVDESHMLDDATRAAVLDCAKRGRKRSAYVVVATHRPTRDALPKVLTDQLAWRIVGRVEDAAGSKVAAGVTGAQWLAGAGDMMLAHGGQVVRIQAALGEPADWARLQMSAEAPAAAPRVIPPADLRYVRADNTERIEWLVERWEREGKPPTQYALNRAFGGASTRNSRAAAEASQALGLAS